MLGQGSEIPNCSQGLDDRGEGLAERLPHHGPRHPVERRRLGVQAGNDGQEKSGEDAASPAETSCSICPYARSISTFHNSFDLHCPNFRALKKLYRLTLPAYRTLTFWRKWATEYGQGCHPRLPERENRLRPGHPQPEVCPANALHDLSLTCICQRWQRQFRVTG